MRPDENPETELTWQLRVSRRARYAKLQIKPFGGLEVVIPPRFPRHAVADLVAQHATWARRQLARQSRLRESIQLPQNLSLAFDGSSTPVIYRSDSLQFNFDLFDEPGLDRIIIRSEGQQARIRELRVWLRRRAQGRTAELDGEAALPADRLARMLEIVQTAEAGIERLPATSRSVLEAYAAGVNARITRIRQGRVSVPRMLAGSIEELEEWRPADSLAVVKLLSWCIGGTLETTLVLDDLIQRLDSMPARPFFPGRVIDRCRRATRRRNV